MAQFNSDQYKKAYVDVPRVRVAINSWGGRVRIKWFDVPATVGLAQNDTVRLCKLDNNSRVIGGRVHFGAYGASVTLDIGTAAAEDRYLAALDISSAGEGNFGDTLTLNFGDKLTAETDLIAKFEGANPDDTKILKGYVLYVLD